MLTAGHTAGNTSQFYCKFCPKTNKKAFIFFFHDFIYLFLRDTEAQTQAEGEAGSLRGAQCGTPSQDPGSCPEPKANAQPLPPVAQEGFYLDSHGQHYLVHSVRREGCQVLSEVLGIPLIMKRV